MPREATIGRLLLENALPEGVRGELGVLDKKGVARLGAALAALGPDAYREAMRKLTQVSNQGGYESGGYSFGPEDMIPGPQTRAIRDDLKQQVSRILANPRLDQKTRDNEISRVSLEAMQPLQDAALGEARAANNPLAKQVDSGAKGSGVNLRALLAGDVVYTDQNFRPIPYPVVHSFAEGMRPHEYAASTFGARQSISQTKLGTAKGGYLSKRLGNMAHRLVVTAHDGPSAGADDAPTGLPVKTSDPDNENGFLAHPVGGFQRNTHLTRDVLSTLQKQGIDKILVRSPLVGGPEDGGVYGLDVGVRERNRVSPIGDFVGRAAADSLSEPVTQSIIGCLVKGTLVRMADWSVKSIEQITVGDRVIGADEAGRTFPVDVTHTFDNGVRECVRTVFVRGKRSEELVLESTADHKLLAATRMSMCKEAEFNGVPRQLPVGKKAKCFYAMSTTKFEVEGLAHEPRALLLGLLLGDGCFTEALNGVFLSCGDPQLIDDLGPYAASLNLKLVHCQAGGGLMYRLSQIEEAASTQCPTTGRILPGARNPARQLLIEFGLDGKYSYEKFIPDAVLGWDNPSVAALLTGLFISDGSVYQTMQSNYPFINYGSTSRVMLERFRELAAWRFGIHFGPIHANTTRRERPLYGTDLARFKDVVRLRDVFTALCGVKRTTYDTLVDAAREYQKTANMTAVARADTDTRSSRRSQTSIGLRHTYDIEVACASHLFVLANGLIVSNSKHTGGVAGTTGVQQGFDTIERMFSVPSVYQGGVTHAQRDGSITDVRPAPQGGHYVVVDGEEHYVHPDLKPIVTTGTKVEAGDPLSDGVLNPHELVQHKGIGEARRQFVNEFLRVGKLSSVNAHRRNVELVARGFIDHVHMNQEYGDYSPGEIAPYTVIASEYEPRDGHQRVSPKDAKGMYLERPAIHYTIGTRITPSVVDTLNSHGVATVAVHKEPPPFSPVLIRSNDSLAYDRDWATQMLGSGLEKSLLKSVARGAVSDPGGTSYVPALAEGVHFGDPGTKTRGWTPPSKPGLV